MSIICDKPVGQGSNRPDPPRRLLPLGLLVLGVLVSLSLTAELPVPVLAQAVLAQEIESASPVTPRELDDRLVGTWVLDFQLTEQLSQQRLGIGDSSIQLRFTPRPELSPEDLELAPELETVEALPTDAEVRSAGRLAFGNLGEGVYFVTGPDDQLSLHYVRETEEGHLGAPWTFRLTLRPVDPPRQDLLVLGGGDRFNDPPLAYARRSREVP